MEYENNTTDKIYLPEVWNDLPYEGRRSIVAELFEAPSDELIDSLISLIKAPKGYGVYASIGPNYQYAVFGRDSLEVAEDTLESRPELTHEILLALARRVGRRHLDEEQNQKLNEEEEGKMFHEYRARHFGDVAISAVAESVLERLSEQWGGTSEEMLYYGTVDATPLFVRTAARYVNNHGEELLDEVVTDQYGVEQTFRTALRSSMEHLVGKVENSPWSLLEFKRLNPLGLPYQAWKDSDTGYLHYSGQQANADGGIASVEVQGLAYDALKSGAELVAVDDSEARHWQDLAHTLQQATLQQLWLQDQQFFAIGLDRSPGDGSTRQIDTLTSNSAALLDSDLLLDLPEQSRQTYVEPIVKRIMSTEFLTDAGIRCRSLTDESRLKRGADYHGALVTWPKETYDIAKGLRRHGYIDEAEELDDCLKSAFVASGEFREFYYVKPDGKARYRYRVDYPDEPQFHEDNAVNTPEPGHAWSFIAGVAIAARSL